jgi:hypothetical protein
MKKLLFPLFFIFLFSCEREDYYCWKCETKAKEYESTLYTCEMTESQARQFERGMLIQAMAMTDSLAMVICSETECLNN